MNNLIFQLWALFWLSCLPLQAQMPTKIREIALPALPTRFSADIYQRLYTAEDKGIIRQYDTTGKQTAYYSPTQIAEVTALEARFGVRVFAFYQDLQSFTAFNRFLQPIETHKFNPEKIGFAQNIAWSADQSIWVWDSQDMNLKKYKPLTEEITFQISLFNIKEVQEIAIEVVRMQEYENRLYIFDKTNRVLIFDYFGNFLTSLAYPPQCVLVCGKGVGMAK